MSQQYYTQTTFHNTNEARIKKDGGQVKRGRACASCKGSKLKVSSIHLVIYIRRRTKNGNLLVRRR